MIYVDVKAEATINAVIKTEVAEKAAHSLSIPFHVPLHFDFDAHVHFSFFICILPCDCLGFASATNSLQVLVHAVWMPRRCFSYEKAESLRLIDNFGFSAIICGMKSP